MFNRENETQVADEGIMEDDNYQVASEEDYDEPQHVEEAPAPEPENDSTNTEDADPIDNNRKSRHAGGSDYVFGY